MRPVESGLIGSENLRLPMRGMGEPQPFCFPLQQAQRAHREAASTGRAGHSNPYNRGRGNSRRLPLQTAVDGMPREASKREIPTAPARERRSSVVPATAARRATQEQGIPRPGCHTESLPSAGCAWVVHVVEPVIAPVGAAKCPAFVRRIDGVLRDANGTLGVGSQFNWRTCRSRLAGFIGPDA